MEPSRVPWKPTDWYAVTTIVFALLVFGPFGLYFGCLAVAGGAAMLADRLSGKPPLLERAVTVASPEGTRRFVAQIDGCLTITDARGRTLWTERISPNDYRALRAVWESPRRVRLELALRYPAMANGIVRVWDLKTGRVIDPDEESTPGPRKTGD
ncbi:MAG: hypothetical protein SFU56_22820 [Capsulimonadales bacterium]|nr:hypothetical protein [Capsulimonadales bacterium]